MPDFHLPLSGNVSQVLDPWTWCLRAVGGQLGLVNINLGKSSDPDLEEQILDDVGSYGRQLGQIGDALRVLLNHFEPKDLTGEETTALQAFRYQIEEIDRLKANRGDRSSEGSRPRSRVRRQADVLT